MSFVLKDPLETVWALQLLPTIVPGLSTVFFLFLPSVGEKSLD